MPGKTARLLIRAGIAIGAILFLGAAALAIAVATAQPRLTRRTPPAAPPPGLWLGWSYDGAYALEVDAPVALMDRPVAIRATGFTPGQPVTLTLSTTHPRTHQVWRSFAVFKADTRGIVDVLAAAPLYGTYSGIDAMGLFWSMLPAGAEDPGSMGLSVGIEGYTVDLRAEADGKILAAAGLKRLVQTEVAVRDLREDGLFGRFICPSAPGRYPAVVMWGGSEGGLSDLAARLLASHGYAVLALAYFRYESLPVDLDEIPLEYFGRAIAWVRAQPEVDGGRVAVKGGSRGAEAALLVAAEYPDDVCAVIATAPSSLAWQGSSVGGYLLGRSSWTRGGKPVACLRQALTPDIIGTVLGIGGPYQHLTSFNSVLGSSAAEAASIAVERIRGPVLLISGTDDRMWPSTRMSGMIMGRLEANGHPYPDRHLSYPGAGHGINIPYGPTVGVRSSLFVLGGTMEANAAANASSWAETLSFLERELKGRAAAASTR